MQSPWLRPCLFLVGMARGVAAQAAPPADPMPAHDSLTIASLSLGEPRRINIHTPEGYARSGSTRFPVLYMPDGGLDEDFPHVVRAVDSLIALRAIRPVIVVGIPNTQRRRDLTGFTRVGKDSTIAPRVGGSAAFRQFIRDELFPVIDARYRTTSERSIIGESLAGLFIVETFLLSPGMFSHAIALDPSVWWNAFDLVNAAPERLRGFDAAPRSIFLANSNVEDIAAGTARLDSALRVVKPRGVRWVYVPRPDLTHATIFRGLEYQALAAALK